MAITDRTPTAAEILTISTMANGDVPAKASLYDDGLHVLQDFSTFLLTRLALNDPSRTIVFTATAATDLISFATATGFATGQPVVVSSSGVLPAGLSANTVYFLRDVSGNYEGATAKLALTSGGAAIDLTDAGSGAHTIKGLPRMQAPSTLTDANHTITPYSLMFALATPTANRTLTFYDSRAIAGQFCYVARPSTGNFSWTITRETSGDGICALTALKACSVLMMAYDNGSGSVKWHPLFLSADGTYGIDP